MKTHFPYFIYKKYFLFFFDKKTLISLFYLKICQFNILKIYIKDVSDIYYNIEQVNVYLTIRTNVAVIPQKHKKKV